MTVGQDQTPFVAIGGLGGSGTRIVAEIVGKLGFYLGPVLNAQMDSLLFTLMFKQRPWFDQFPTDAKVDRTITNFASAMQHGVSQAFRDIPSSAIKDWYQNAKGMGVSLPVLIDILRSDPPDMSVHSGVAWKEPNTHVFLPHLMRNFPNMKYIHVVRHGLDMALSGNRQQLNNWGRHFGIDPDASVSPSSSQLEYWLAANHKAIDLGKKMKQDHFYVLNYDALCEDFKSQLAPLEGFLNRSLTDSQRAYFSGHIGSSSIGRYKSVPAGTFSDTERQAVQNLGFAVD
mgnify:CR=1 FL=1